MKCSFVNNEQLMEFHFNIEYFCSFLNYLKIFALMYLISGHGWMDGWMIDLFLDERSDCWIDSWMD